MESQCTYFVRPNISHVIVGVNYWSVRCASSKHLQTRRFLDTLQSYLLDVQRILIQLHLAANQRAEPFVDHAGILRDSKTGRPISGLQLAERDAADAYDDYSNALSK